MSDTEPDPEFTAAREATFEAIGEALGVLFMKLPPTKASATGVAMACAMSAAAMAVRYEATPKEWMDMCAHAWNSALTMTHEVDTEEN